MSGRDLRTGIARIAVLALFAGLVYAIGQTIPHRVLTLIASAVWG